ncbi:SPICE1 [Acanthosepion pharaonis]|uniref:Spindle and centriole-associated protein 1 n=1 Tax=Acanthosepion pharaonis TaxID=158019 RepID=A0A812DBF3_ACAPH|nr:SPICE1 [Sepia pharaonis]
MKAETINASWKNLWHEIIHDYKGFTPGDISQVAVESDEGSQATSTYTSQIDMERFRKLLAAEEENLKNACATPNQHDIFAKIQADSESDKNTITPDTSLFGAPNSAVNDTKKVNRVRKIIAEDPIQSGTQVVLDGTVPAGLSLSDLKKVLEELQSEMELYEQNTGRITAEKEHRETFSGYTMALLSSVIKLSRYLRETEEKLQAEKKTRDVLAAEVSDLKIIVDALTSDLIQTQEMYQNLESELRNYQQRMDQEICLLKRQAGFPLSDCCKEENVSPASSLAAAALPSLPQTLIPPPHLSTTNKYEMEARNMIRKTKSLEPENSENHPGLNLNKQIEPFFPVFQSAFQLSPPVQKTRVFTQNGTGQQLSLVGIEELALNTPSHVGQPQKVPSIQASVHQALPKQHVTDIVISKTIQLETNDSPLDPLTATTVSLSLSLNVTLV